MSEKQFGVLLRQAHAAAAKHSALAAQVTAAFRDRYGCTHSDVDADGLIESLDYGQGRAVTVRDADEEMAACGAPKLRIGENADEA